MTQEKYLFALLPSEEVPPLTAVKSFGDQALQRLDYEGLTAVIAPMPEGRLRPRRSNLRIHHRVIDHLIEHGASPLPFAFGTAAPGRELKGFLEGHCQELAQRMEHIRGCVETTLKVRVEADKFYEFLLSTSDELARLRDALYGGDREPTREQKIEMGQKVEQWRQQLSDQLAETMATALADDVVDISTQEPTGDGQLAHLVCLVSREQTEAFEASLNAVAEGLDEALVIHLAPYLAPYHFADLKF